jgi:hypothetical protein
MKSSPSFHSLLAAGALALLSACGGSLDIPDALPIVQDTLPTTLKDSTGATFMARSVSQMDTQLLAADSDITELKTRLFSAGPTDFQYRLSSIDGRMNELEERAGSCEDEDAKAWSVPVGSTGIPLTTMYFQCYTNVTGPGVSDYKIYFGKKGGYWYLAELQINDNFESNDGEPPTMGVLAKIADDSTSVEAYQITVEKVSSSYYATITQILADKTGGIFEVSSASTADSTQVLSPGANMTGLGCGIQMKTDGTNIYGSGSFSQAATCAATATPCVLASNFDTTGASCSGINTFSTVAMTRAGLISASAATAAQAIIIDKTGMPTVTELE